MPLTCLKSPQAHLNATLIDGILELAINRPESKNALYGALYLAIEQALLEADQEKLVRVVLIRGAHADFSAGNDIKEFANFDNDSIDAPAFRLLRAAAHFSKPLICAVKGVAVGIGTTLLMHADLVYCDSSARFQMPFVSLGLSPEGAATLLIPQSAGYHKAAELLLLAEPFNAETALSAGIVNAIIEDDVYAFALKKAQRLVSLPAKALLQTKILLKQVVPASTIERINVEGEVFIARTKSPEMKEAVTAFMQKRPANFRQFE